MISAIDCQIDVIVLTEVKLKTSFPVQIYSIPGYSRFVCLRSEQGGGGILVFIKSSITASEEIGKPNQFEKLSLHLDKNGNKLRLIVYYRAPKHDNFRSFMDDLEASFHESRIQTMIMGDININTGPAACDPVDLEYAYLLESYGFEVTNKYPTRPASGRVIDHFATNISSKFPMSNATISIDPIISDHNIVISSINFNHKLARNPELIERTKISYKKLIENFPDVREKIFSSNDANEIAETLTNAIKTSIISSSVEVKLKMKHLERLTDFNSLKALELMKTKDKLLNKHRKKPNSEKILHELQNTSRELKKITKRDLISSIHQKVQVKDPRKKWQNINSLLGRDTAKTSPTSLVFDNETTADPAEIGNIFNKFFTNCANELRQEAGFASHEAQDQFTETTAQSSMFLTPPTTREVQTIIKSLRNSTAPGHDNIGPKVTKRLAPALSDLIVHLLNVIFTTGVYPKIFKIAVVTPIFKSGSNTEVGNYRPISVLPVLNKITEKAIQRRLSAFVHNKLRLIDNNQFGFRPRSGTENASIELTNEILQSIDEKNISIGVFMDLRKAFDVVNHTLLINVLNKYGIRGNVLKIFGNYLNDRHQVVKISSTLSKTERINHGVVQGSCLGPLLYLIFFNAIGSLPLIGKLFLFADDALLVHKATKPDVMIEAIKKDMTTILEFFKHRQLIVNSEKTNFMIFKSSYKKVEIPDEIYIDKNLTLKRLSTIKYLGLHLDENMRWNKHMAHTEKKIAAVNGVLWKLRDYLPQQTKKLIYDSLLQPHLNYMTPLWGLASCKAINHAQILQNRALRNVYNLEWRINRVEMYTHKVESHLPIRGLTVLNTATYMYKNQHGLTHSNIQFTQSRETHKRILRNSNDLRPSSARTNYGLKSIESFGPKVFNKVPANIKKSAHQHQFTWSLRCHLRNETFISSCFNASFFDLTF